jgi:hypothetical protein
LFSDKKTDALTIVLLESICGLKNTSHIHQWASNDRGKIFLKEEFLIEAVPDEADKTGIF